MPPLLVPPPCPPQPGAPRTLALVLDGEAEDVAGAEPGAVVHAAVEERVRVGVLDVEDLAGGGHVPGDALVGGDADLIALWVGDGGDGHGRGGGQDPRTPTQTPTRAHLVVHHATIEHLGHQLVAEPVQQEHGASARDDGRWHPRGSQPPTWVPPTHGCPPHPLTSPRC